LARLILFCSIILLFPFSLFATDIMTEPPGLLLKETEEIVKTFQQPSKEDLEIAEKIKEAGEIKVELVKDKPAINICDYKVKYLISFSMPLSDIETLLESAIALNKKCIKPSIQIGIRGFIDNNFKTTLSTLYKINQKINSDLPLYLLPEVFEKYNVKEIPHIIVEAKNNITEIIGDTSIEYAIDVAQKDSKSRIITGMTYPVKEQDIKTALKKNIDKVIRTARENAKKPLKYVVSYNLEKADKDRTFYLDPSYTIQEDIISPDGKIVAKKGTVINPADYVPLGKYIIIDGRDEKQIQFALKEKPKKIIIASGDPIELTRKYKTPFYFATDEVINGFAIKRTPSVIQQEGRYILVTEKKID